MRQTACLVINPVIVDGYVSLFDCKAAVSASDSMTAPSKNFNQGAGASHTVELAMSTRLCLL